MTAEVKQATNEKDYTVRLLIQGVETKPEDVPRPAPVGKFLHVTAAYLGKSYSDSATAKKIEHVLETYVKRVPVTRFKCIKEVKMGPKLDLDAMEVEFLDETAANEMKLFSKTYGKLEEWQEKDANKLQHEKQLSNPRYHVTLKGQRTFCQVGDVLTCVVIDIKPLGPFDPVMRFPTPSTEVHTL